MDGETPEFQVPGPGFVSFYERLGVSRSATEEQVNKAYREKALYYHPDRHPLSERDVWKDAFQELGEIKDTLLDPKKRTTYNTQLGKIESDFLSKQEKFAAESSKSQETRSRRYVLEEGSRIPCLNPLDKQIYFGLISNIVWISQGLPGRVTTVISQNDRDTGEKFSLPIKQRGYVANTLCSIFNYLDENPTIYGSVMDYDARHIETLIREYVRTGDTQVYEQIPRTDNLRKMSKVLRNYIDERNQKRSGNR